MVPDTCNFGSTFKISVLRLYPRFAIHHYTPRKQDVYFNHSGRHRSELDSTQCPWITTVTLSLYAYPELVLTWHVGNLEHQTAAQTSVVLKMRLLCIQTPRSISSVGRQIDPRADEPVCRRAAQLQSCHSNTTESRTSTLQGSHRNLRLSKQRGTI